MIRGGVQTRAQRKVNIMTKKQAEHWGWLRGMLDPFSVSERELDTLIRASSTLSRWAERECGDGSNWSIERDEETGIPYNVYHGPGNSMRYRIRDMESGALRRVKAICDSHGLVFYHQTDPRGC